MTTKNKARLFLGLLLAMITYIGWSFYISEPKYINGISNKKLEPYDLITVDDDTYSYTIGTNVKTAIVLQMDETFALIKTTSRWGDSFKQIKVGSGQYRIVGRGTIYHKVNSWVGFNIMLISQALITIILALLLITKLELLNSII